jgi:hypothetical protein
MSSLLDLKGMVMPSLIQSSSLIGYVNILVYITYYDQYDPTCLNYYDQLTYYDQYLQGFSYGQERLEIGNQRA